jgi:acyl-CoA thioester hydrolase
VYWEDTDAGGVVFYANYLKFFERARTEWLRHLGVAQQALRESTGAIFVVTDTRVRYRAPARLDDLSCGHRAVLAAQGTASMTLQQQAWRGQTLLAEGEIRIGCVDAEPSSPAAFPEVIASHEPHPHHLHRHEPGPVHHRPHPARQPGGAAGDGGPAAHLAGQLDGDLRQALRPAQRARPQRRLRARVLVRPQPDRD